MHETTTLGTPTAPREAFKHSAGGGRAALPAPIGKQDGGRRRLRRPHLPRKVLPAQADRVRLVRHQSRDLPARRKETSVPVWGASVELWQRSLPAPWPAGPEGHLQGLHPAPQKNQLGASSRRATSTSRRGRTRRPSTMGGWHLQASSSPPSCCSERRRMHWKVWRRRPPRPRVCESAERAAGAAAGLRAPFLCVAHGWPRSFR